ncbi:MAG: glycosyltransferase family 4 protein [Ginsengibacter sp.]
MRILHLLYTQGVAGAEKHLLDLLPELKKYGIDYELLCITSPKCATLLKEYCAEMEQKGVKTTLITSKSKIFFLSAAKKISRHLKLNKFYIVHSHLFNADLLVVLVKKFYFKKLIILSTKHGYEEKYQFQIGLGNRKIRYNAYYFISRWVIKQIDHNLAVSRAISDLYYHLKFSKHRMKHVHHGIRIPLNEKGKLLKGNPKILMVGRLVQIKGHIYLIQALPAIIKKFPELKVIIAGEGPIKNQLITQANNLNVFDHIEFVGFTAPRTYSSQCQLMVLPSLFESFGLVYIESFALKIPVIAFDTQAANEIIEHNKTGILVEKEDVNALAEKIIYLLESPEERKRIAENAYQRFETYYNVERMAKETVEWYHSVLKSDK